MNRPVLIFALAMFAAAFIGFSHACRVTSSDRYNDSFNVPAFDKPGYDFSYAIKWVSQMGSNAPFSNMYPPAAATSFLPFLPFDYPGNYRAFTVVLIGSLFFAILLSLSEGRTLDGPSLVLFSAVFLAVLYSSWWFQLELERGNSNTFVSMLCAGGFLALTRDRPMVAAICFAEATQLRVYPVILIVFVFLRSDFRPVILFTVLNVMALFFAGWANLVAFVKAISYWQDQTIGLDVNHSLATAGYFYGFSPNVPFMKVMLLFIFFAATYLFWRERQRTGRPGARSPLTVAEVALVGLAFQLMDLLPNVSWDYKLSIQTVPFLLLISRREWRKVCSTSTWMCLVGSVAVAYGFICSAGSRPKVPAHLINVIAYTVIFLISYRKSKAHAVVLVHPSTRPLAPAANPAVPAR